MEWNRGTDRFLDEEFTYDANSNILNANRQGVRSNHDAAAMDSLTYSYYTGTNRLSHVDDKQKNNPLPGYFDTDIENQSANNYSYDAIGNLTKDNAENLVKITWTVYGKIDSIYKQSK